MKLWIIYSFLTCLLSSIVILSFKYLDVVLNNEEEVKILIYLGFIIAAIVGICLIMYDKPKNVKSINNIVNNSFTNNRLLILILLFMGILLVGIKMSHFYAMTYSNNPGLPLIIVNMNVILVLALSLLIFRMVLNWKVILGIILAVCGISTVIYFSDE